jgi:hypothetical protein
MLGGTAALAAEAGAVFGRAPPEERARTRPTSAEADGAG